MSQTILQYLTTRNLNLSVEVSGPTYTTHDAWAPVESIQLWPDFTYDILVNRFREVLRLPIDPFNYVFAFENAQLNIITSEPSFDIALAGNIAKVSSALHMVKKSLFMGGGSRIIKDQSWGRPDWGAGDSMIRYADRPDICQGILCGDTKVLWDPQEASKFVNDKRQHYERLPSRRNAVSPFEQVQHYCQQWGTRYGFIITDKSLVVIRLKLSPPSSSQRQLRQIRDTQSSGHKRILSDASIMTDVSETFSAMSFEPPSDEQDIGGLEVTTIPWDHGKGKVLTINLALFLLVLLAETERHLSDHYDYLDKGEKIRVPAIQTQPDKRRRESESQGSLTQTQQKTQKFTGSEMFVPGGSIYKDVIFADIGVYIPGATVRVAEHQGKKGFMISHSREAAFEKDELVSMLSDLKADTAKWDNEGQYKESKVSKSRHHHGSSYRRARK